MFGAAVGAFDLWLIEAAVGLPIASKPAVHGPTPLQYRWREYPAHLVVTPSPTPRYL